MCPGERPAGVGTKMLPCSPLYRDGVNWPGAPACAGALFPASRFRGAHNGPLLKPGLPDPAGQETEGLASGEFSEETGQGTGFACGLDQRGKTGASPFEL